MQYGVAPSDWKPMRALGQGARSGNPDPGRGGAFRVLYVAKFAEAVYVLHCFQKKTQQTSKADLALASKRYDDLTKERQR